MPIIKYSRKVFRSLIYDLSVQEADFRVVIGSKEDIRSPFGLGAPQKDNSSSSKNLQMIVDSLWRHDRMIPWLYQSKSERRAHRIIRSIIAHFCLIAHTKTNKNH